jgi:Outer membrane protein beta-barrel domain
MKRYLLCFFLFSSTAFANLLIEPYVGYGFSTGGEVQNSPILLDYDGIYAGGRLGVTIDPLMFGVLYDFMWFDSKVSSVNSPYYNILSTDQTNFGAFIGANFQSGLRFWGEYLFEVKNDYSFDSNGINYSNYDKGWGWGLGIGYAVAKNLAFNFQYRNLTLDETPATVYNPYTNKVLVQELLLTLSLPVYPF